jgi:hypothetical protein
LLTLSADPWAYVSIDGKDRGLAPISKLAVAPGLHEVTFENPDLHVTRREAVRLRPGEERLMLERLLEAPR